MADTTTLAKAFIKPEVGSHPDTWGYVLNDNLDLIDRAVGGAIAIAISGDYSLSVAQAENLTYEISGALGADAVLTFPAFRGMAFVRNLTSGGFRVFCQMVTNGAVIPVLPGVDRLLVGDGVDFFSNVAAVAKTGDTMSGPLVIITPGTCLAVSDDIVAGHNIQAGNTMAAPSFSSYGFPVLAGAGMNTGFTVFYDNTGAADIFLGNTNDQTNYYRQTNHRFQGRGGTPEYAFFNAGGNSLWGSLTINNAATPGTLTISGSGTAVYVPNGGAYFGADLTVGGNAHVNGPYIFLGGGGGAVNTVGGPCLYGDASNNVWKLGPNNGSFLFQNYGGGNIANMNAGGGLTVSGLAVTNNGSFGSVSTGPISTTGLSSSGSVGASGIIQSNSNAVNAIYASAGGIYTEGNFYCKGSGITFNNIGNNGFNFRWDGTYAYVRIDNAVEYPIANAGTFGSYLPTGGGTISGGLNVNGYLNAFGGLGVNNGLSVNSGGMGVNGQATFNSYAVANGGFGVNGGGTINGGLTSGGNVVINGALSVSANATFSGGQNTFNSGGLAVYLPSGFMQSDRSGTAIYLPNGNMVYQNSQSSNDTCAGGVFRNYILGTGPRGARIECWNGSGWDAMSFAIISGGYLGVSPDQGGSGYNYAPNGSWSDARLKTNIRDSEVDALAVVRSIPLRAFEWNEEGRKLMHRSGPVLCGFVAQDLEEQIPVAVDLVPVIGDLTGGGMRNVLDQHLTPYLFRAIQQIADRLEALEAA